MQNNNKGTKKLLTTKDSHWKVLHSSALAVLASISVQWLQHRESEWTHDLSWRTPTPSPGSLHILSHHTPHLYPPDLYLYSSSWTQNCVLCVTATKTKTQNNVAEKETNSYVSSKASGDRCWLCPSFHQFEETVDLYFSANPIFRSLTSRLKLKSLKDSPFFFFLVNVSYKTWNQVPLY